MLWHGTTLLRDGAQGDRRFGTTAGPVASRRRRSHGDEDCQRLGLGERRADWRQRHSRRAAAQAAAQKSKARQVKAKQSKSRHDIVACMQKAAHGGRLKVALQLGRMWRAW
jgi:hypothetical protein